MSTSAGHRRGVPVSRLGDTFESFDLALNPGMKPAYDQCRAVAEGAAWCALLCGHYGNGKTHLAIAALGVRHSFQSGMFWKVPDFLAFIRRRVFDDGEPEDEVLRGYRFGDALVVFDDLGAEQWTEWAGQQLYRVLDSRYDAKLPTIITSNQEPRKLDGRIMDRYSSGIVVCEGKSVRGLVG